MEWIRQNWVFILFALFFIAMHFWGHGGCGGGRKMKNMRDIQAEMPLKRKKRKGEKDAAEYKGR